MTITIGFSVYVAPKPAYTVAVNIDPAGSGSVTGAGQYEEGATANLNATANDGYQFGDWKENGESVHNDPDYSFPVTGDRGLTAAFVEKKTSRLPEGYTEVEYIQSDGGQYISTGAFPYGLNTLEMDVEPLYNGDSTPRYFYYDYYRSTSYYFALAAFWNGSGVSAFIGYDTKSPTYKTVDSSNQAKRMLIKVNSASKSVQVNDNTPVYFSYATYNTGMGQIILLSTGSAAYGVPAKLYSCKIGSAYSSSSRDFVPCTNPSGQAGLYDLVNSAFYGNAGTGAFTTGPAV